MSVTDIGTKFRTDSGALHIIEEGPSDDVRLIRALRDDGSLVEPNLPGAGWSVDRITRQFDPNETMYAWTAEPTTAAIEAVESSYSVGDQFTARNDSLVYTVEHVTVDHVTVVWTNRDGVNDQLAINRSDAERHLTSGLYVKVPKEQGLAEWEKELLTPAPSDESEDDKAVRERAELVARIATLEAEATALREGNAAGVRDALNIERRRIITSLDDEAERRSWCDDYDTWLEENDLTDYSARDPYVSVNVTATFSVSIPRSAADSSSAREEIFEQWTPSSYDIDTWEVDE